MNKFRLLTALALAALLALPVACVVQPGDAAEVEAPPTTAVATAPSDLANAGLAGYPAVWWVGQFEAVPNPARVGQAVRVWANVYMADIPISYINAYLLVNGQVVARQQLVVVFDDSTPFSFTFTPEQPGVYEITVRAVLAENEASPDPEVAGLNASASGSLVVTA